MRDLQNLLLDAIPLFEFPRSDLSDYTIDVLVKNRSEVVDSDFVIGLIWHELTQSSTLDDYVFNDDQEDKVLVDNSVFNSKLSSEEINILATLMLCGWTQRQVTSIENTRMKYSGADFKMTSQANHLSKLLSLLDKAQSQAHHLQRLYKRRRSRNNAEGQYRSNWDVFGRGVYYDRTNN